MSRQITEAIFCKQNNILVNGEHFVSVLVKVNASKVVANAEGKKVVPAGSIISKEGLIVNDTTAYGVTLNSIDVTNGNEGVPTAIHGFIDLEALPVEPNEEARAAMKQIAFI